MAFFFIGKYVAPHSPMCKTRKHEASSPCTPTIHEPFNIRPLMRWSFSSSSSSSPYHIHRHIPIVETSAQLSSTISALHLCARHNAPGTDDVVGVASEQGLAIGAPGEGHALGVTGVLGAGGLELRLELVDLGLLLEVEDDDAGGGGSAQPVAVGGEDQRVDLVVGVQGVEVLGLVQVPQHGGTVLATGGAQRAIGRDGDGVDVTGVANVVSLQLAGGELPDLSEYISMGNGLQYMQLE